MGNTPQSRLDAFIEHLGMTKSELSKRMGRKETYISAYTSKRGLVLQQDSMLDKLASFGLNKHWYLTGEGEMLLTEVAKEPTNVANEPEIVYAKRTNIELLPVPANAGRGYNFEPSSFTYEVPSAFSMSRYKAIRISGDSMHPTIPNDAVVVFDSVQIEPVHDRIVIAIVDGVLYCKRVFITENDVRYLVSDNKDYEKIKINGFHNTKILGTAVEVKYYL